MKTLIAALAFAAIALPGAAQAAEEAKAKCCCDKMKEKDMDCCKDKDAAAPADDHSGHAEHPPKAPAD